MRYLLKCKCGAEGVGYGHRGLRTNKNDLTEDIIDEIVEWEGGINDDFDPEIDNKDHLCKHEDYEIEDSEDDREYDWDDYHYDSSYGIDRTY